MIKLLPPISILAALAVVLAGCGGSGGSSGAPNGGGGVNGITVGNCLNENYDFIVQPSTRVLDGTSPTGVGFTMTLFKTSAAAHTAAAKKSKKTTAVVENAVVDFRGNPSAYAGAPAAKISPKELGNIRTCIDQSKAK